jgi:PhnB protein
MTTVNIYLTFLGNCEEAFNFYQSVFGGEFSVINRFKEMPPQEGMPSLPPEMAEKIMHVSLPISKETILMGSDTGGDWGKHIVMGNNFSISVGGKDIEEGKRIFEGLSAGGKITMPYAETFWGAMFGSCTDKFGVNWMINIDHQPE